MLSLDGLLILYECEKEKTSLAFPVVQVLYFIQSQMFLPNESD